MTKTNKTQTKILTALSTATGALTSGELGKLIGVTQITTRNNAEKLVQAKRIEHGPSRRGAYTYCENGKRETLAAEFEAAEADRVRREAVEAGQVECQVCERWQCADARGRLVNHGYTRPGWGFIVGGCDGVGHKPFPETNALESYLVRVLAAQAENTETLNHKDVWTSLRVRDTDAEWKLPYSQRKEIYKTLTRPTAEQLKAIADAHATYKAAEKSRKTTKLTTSDESYALYKVWQSLAKVKTDWADAHKREVQTLTSYAAELVAEVERVTNRIAKGKAMRAELAGVVPTRASTKAAKVAKRVAKESASAIAKVEGELAELRDRYEAAEVAAQAAQKVALDANFDLAEKRAELTTLKGGK